MKDNSQRDAEEVRHDERIAKLHRGACSAKIVKAILVATLAPTVALGTLPLWGIDSGLRHDSNRPDLKAWFESLRSKAGEPCCDTGDAEHAEATWDMAKRGYKVLLRNPQKPNEAGEWFDVPDLRWSIGQISTDSPWFGGGQATIPTEQ